jgi:hypothetical protein
MLRARSRLLQTISLGCVAFGLTGCELVVGSDPARIQPGDDGSGGVLDPFADVSSPDPTSSQGTGSGEGGAQQDGTSGSTQPTDDATSPGADGPSTTGSDGSLLLDGSLGSDGSLARPDGSMSGMDGGSQTGDATADSPSTGTGDTGTVCAATIPAGWSPAVFNTGLDPCPAGFAEHVVLGTPSVAAGACSCSCSVTQPGACGGQGSLTLTGAPGHGVDTCTSPWFTATVNGAQCIAVPAASQLAFEAYQATPVAATGQGGACSSAVQSNPGALSEPAQRFCDVPAPSADAVCAGTAPAGFSACIVAAGNVACPSSTPFVQAFAVEDGATVSCGACSACSVSTTCSNPTVAAFTNANCTAPATLTFNVDGSCTSIGNELTMLSIQYSATANAACTAGSSSASVQLTGAKTICCR